MRMLLFLLIGMLCGGSVMGAAGATNRQARRAQLIIEKVPKEQQICFCLYTVQKGVLKLTAQLYPLEPGDEREVRLELLEEGKWREVARTRVRENEYGNGRWKGGVSDRSWVALFRIEKWDATRDVRYRVRHGASAMREGLIRRDPVEKEEIVVAAFTGNGNNDRRLKPDLVKNVRAQNPDLLFFSGDQSYDHTDHLYAWLLFGRQYGELTKDRPTISIPDDHDVGQGNIWGAGGKVASTADGADGGYFMPVEYVKEVQFAQTAHMPDPPDAAPIQRGIGVYYCALNVARVSFAVIEDRKWKSGPQGLVPQRGPRPDHVNDASVDPKSLDVAGAELLGERQLKFLREWAEDWRGANMKSVLSQTIFAGVPHLHRGQRLLADLDSNGWPQSGRNRALEEMRRGFAFHIGGDQHLACVIQYGIEEWNDGPWAFCVPSIVNYYPRAWDPVTPPAKAVETVLPKTGDYRDGFGNFYTMVAYANPDAARSNRWGGEWGARADGYGLVRFNTRTRQIRMECWPRGVDATKAGAEQYPGWPVTIDQFHNYSRKSVAWLPRLSIKGMSDPVVQVTDSSGTLVYAVRVKGTEFRPPVFAEGACRVKVGDPDTDRWRTFENVKPAEGDAATLEVVF